MNVMLPTDSWRQRKAEEHADFLAGKIAESDCFMASLFPDAFLDRAGKASTQYVAAIAACGTGADDYPKVMAAIEALVITLNEINDDFDGAVIETGEREEFCEFIDQVILAHGIDIGALAAANDCDPAELTDQWRDW